MQLLARLKDWEPANPITLPHGSEADPCRMTGVRIDLGEGRWGEGET